jgi:hypothetical protein
MAYVKVFKKYVKLQGEGHEGKNEGANRKALSQPHEHYSHTYRFFHVFFIFGNREQFLNTVSLFGNNGPAPRTS